MHWPNIVVQQICDKNQTKGSVSDRDNKMTRKVAEMILFEIRYGPKLNKSKMAVIFKMAAKFEKKNKFMVKMVESKMAAIFKLVINSIKNNNILIIIKTMLSSVIDTLRLTVIHLRINLLK